MTAAAASRFATKIMVYWASRGLTGVKVWAEPLVIERDGRKITVFQVRSNISELLVRGRQLSPS